MNPAWLFPLLAVGFALAGARRWRHGPAGRPAARIWLLLAVAFGAVSLWLHVGPAHGGGP